MYLCSADCGGTCYLLSLSLSLTRSLQCNAACLLLSFHGVSAIEGVQCSGMWELLHDTKMMMTIWPPPPPSMKWLAFFSLPSPPSERGRCSRSRGNDGRRDIGDATVTATTESIYGGRVICLPPHAPRHIAFLIAEEMKRGGATLTHQNHGAPLPKLGPPCERSSLCVCLAGTQDFNRGLPPSKVQYFRIVNSS